MIRHNDLVATNRSYCLFHYKRKANPAATTPISPFNVFREAAFPVTEVIGAVPVEEGLDPAPGPVEFEFGEPVPTGRKVEDVVSPDPSVERLADAVEEASGESVIIAEETAVLEEGAAVVDVARAMKLGE